MDQVFDHHRVLAGRQGQNEVPAAVVPLGAAGRGHVDRAVDEHAHPVVGQHPKRWSTKYLPS